MQIYKILENFHHEVCFSIMLDFINLRNYMFESFFHFNNEMLIKLSSSWVKTHN